MTTFINEPIQVGAVFRRGIVQPSWFIWGSRRIEVRDVTMRWTTQEGQTTILHLGVTDGTSLFELRLNQRALTWSLAGVQGA